MRERGIDDPETPKSDRIVVLMPVFDDWESAHMLLGRLDRFAATRSAPVRILILDDGSTQPAPPDLGDGLKSVERVTLLRLRRNLGHQRAIAIGLAYIQALQACRFVVVMDGDGEDEPERVGELIDACAAGDDRAIVFASRERRSEGLLFRSGYVAFKLLHYALTGRKIEFGNFSVIPYPLLDRLVGVSELWNHYAASVVHARLAWNCIPVPRGRRICGRSRMDFTALVTHGLSAISVYGDTVGVRLLCSLAILMGALVMGIGVVGYIRLFTDSAIPGWATTAVGIMSAMLASMFLICMVFILMILQSRNYSSFLPLRDWKYYVTHQETVHDLELSVHRIGAGLLRECVKMEELSARADPDVSAR